MDEEMYDDEMNNDEMNNDEMEEITEEDIKEKLLFQLEMWDLVAIVDNLFWASLHISNWNQFQQQRKELAEAIQMGPEYAQYIFESQKVKEFFKNMDEKKYNENKMKYKIAITLLNLIENDEDVQKMFIQRLKDIEYDEDDSNLEKAKNVQTITELLVLNRTLLAIEKNSNQDIQSIIADQLENMPIEELVKIYDKVTQRCFRMLPIVNQVIIDRIDEMDEKDFFLFMGNSNTDYLLENPEIKEKIYEKVKEQQSPILCTMYVKFFSKYDDFLDVLLPKVGKNERVNAVVLANVKNEHDEKVTKKLINMINNFSNEEFDRYILFTSECENATIADAIKEKIEALSDEDLKFLFWSYDKMQPARRAEMIEAMLIKRNILQEYDTIMDFIPTEDEEYLYTKKFNEYMYIGQLYQKSFPFPGNYVVGYVDAENDENTNQSLIEAYNKNNNKLKYYKDFLDYIELIAKTEDKALYKTIFQFNKQLKLREDKEIDPTHFDYYMNVIFHLGNRVLGIEDEQFLRKLYLLSDTESMFFDTVIARMDELKMSIPCVYIDQNDSLNQRESKPKPKTKTYEKNDDKPKETSPDTKNYTDKDMGEKD